MKKIKKYFEAAIQIFLAVSTIFTFSYFVNNSLGDMISVVSAQTNGNTTSTPPSSLDGSSQSAQQTPSVPVDLFSNFVIQLAKSKGFGGLPDMSAINPQQILQSIIDSTNGGVSVCPKTKDNKLCQSYTSKDCEEVCAERCVKISSFDSNDASEWPEECKLGICLDTEEGTCEPRSPFEKCTEDGGEWLPPNSNDARCRKGCCILGNQAQFTTNQQCSAKASSLGYVLGTEGAKFDGEIVNEIECLAIAETNADERGACTFSNAESEKENCDIVNYEECNSRGGSFHADKLCSNPELNTICEKKNNTACDEELNVISWYDSCGNRENIFDSEKPDDGWNSGEILPKSESCSTAQGENQDSCGNCFYAAGTKCGEEISGQELDDEPDGNVVCRELSCVDESGKRRENGESWCAYQGKFGTSDLNIPFLGLGSQFLGNDFGPLSGLLGGQRSRDTPGSREFRRTCFEGEIITEACQDYRNEICVEEDSEGQFSQAVCRANRWQECINYNPTVSKGGKLDKAKVIASMLKCETDPDCFVKYVNVDKDFSFPVCVPKYSPGFDQDALDGAKQICSYASQTCNVVYVKELFGGWTCKANCDCETEKFVEELHDLCMSLGDCGSEVNYMGNFGIGGYSVKQKGNFMPMMNRNLGPLYLLQIAGYGNAGEGDFIRAGDPQKLQDSIGASSDDLFGSLGIDIGGGGVGNPIAGSQRKPDVPESNAGGLATAGSIMGLSGTAVALYGAGTQTALVTGIPAMFSAGAAEALQAAGPAIIGVGSAISITALGMTAASMLIDMTGVGRGMSPAMTYGLVGAATAGAAVVGIQFGIYASSYGLMEALGGLCYGTGGIGCIIVVVVIIIIALLAIFGIGDVQIKEYSFICKPWQPPLGGANCELCGVGDGGLNDNLQCSKYACDSLGQSCEFIEQDPNSICINGGKNDVSAPVISPFEDSLTDGFSYEGVSAEGLEIRRSSGEECLTQFESVQLGLQTNEFSVCKMSGSPGSEFDDMADFGNSYLSKEHSQIISTSELSSLVEGGFEPDKRTEVNLYIVCRDALGNTNSQTYAVNFCVWPEDLTAPIVVVISPEVEFLAFDTTEQEVVAATNEPAEVRWSFSEQDFDEMENEFTCDLDGKCVMTLPITETETKICIKAKDNPDKDETERNENLECLWLDLKKTENDLKIDSILPESGKEIETGAVVNTVQLEVETSGGYEGTASCSYSIDGSEKSLFNPPIGNKHTQTFNRLLEGRHVVEILCSDSAGNSAEGQTEFTIKKDTTAPKVTRAYDSSGSLVVITDEIATCAFVNEKPQSSSVCGFAVDNGTIMTGEETLAHSASFDADKIYYVRCADKFGNAPSRCNIVVSGGEF